MQNISPRKVAAVIVMARELSRAEGELRGLIDRMDEEEQAALVAVMWIGRGAFDAGIGTRPMAPPWPRRRHRRRIT